MCNFGEVMQKVVRPQLTEQDEMWEDALHSFLSYYEQNKMFDLYTHGTGPGLLGVVVHSLKMYLGCFIDMKLDKWLPVPVNRKCTLEVYMKKLKDICAKVVVCDQGCFHRDACLALSASLTTKSRVKDDIIKQTNHF